MPSVTSKYSARTVPARWALNGGYHDLHCFDDQESVALGDLAARRRRKVGEPGYRGHIRRYGPSARAPHCAAELRVLPRRRTGEPNRRSLHRGRRRIDKRGGQHRVSSTSDPNTLLPRLEFELRQPRLLQKKGKLTAPALRRSRASPSGLFFGSQKPGKGIDREQVAGCAQHRKCTLLQAKT
jgi:hypothetical protein